MFASVVIKCIETFLAFQPGFGEIMNNIITLLMIYNGTKLWFWPILIFYLLWNEICSKAHIDLVL